MKKAVVLARAVLTSIAICPVRQDHKGRRRRWGVAAVDSHNLSAGYHASNANDSIDKTDDILVSSDGKEPYAVI